MIDKAQEYSPGKKTRIHIEDPLGANKFGWDLYWRLERSRSLKYSPIILLCIGTDRSTGDSLGPLVGTKLSAMNQNVFKIYGILDQPVHASNLKDKLEEIYNLYKDPLIIAVDACLENVESVGYISIGDGSLQPGGRRK